MNVARTVAAAVLLGLAFLPRPAVADVVDEQFAGGNAAAAASNWAEAVAAYRRAAGLLAHPSAVLEHNLGTAYAEIGDLGRATLHLRQALDARARPSTEVAEAARANLLIVRRRAELQATTSGAVIDRPENWWDLLVETLRAPAMAWLSLLAGASALVTYAVHLRRSALGRPTIVTRVALGSMAACYVVAGVLHGLSLRAERVAPAAVVLDADLAAHERPGTHGRIEFTLQAGARVRVVDRAPGWTLVRLPGGLEGWVVDTGVAGLDDAFGGPIGHRGARS